MQNLVVASSRGRGKSLQSSWLLRLLFQPCRLGRLAKLSDALRLVRIPANSDAPSIESALTVELEKWLMTEQNVQQLDSEASKQVPHATFTDFGKLLAGEVGRLFHERLQSLISRTQQQPVVETPALRLGEFVLAPMLSPGLIVTLSAAGAIVGWLWAGVLAATVAFLALLVFLVLASWFLVRRQLRQAALTATYVQLATLVEEASQGVAEQVKTALIDQLVDQIAVQLNPRPLQRSLKGSLE